MKKKIVLLVLSTSILLLAGGCNKKDNLDNNSETTPTPVATQDTDTPENTETPESPEAPEQVVNTVVKEAYNVDDYITLGKYKGIEVTVDKLEVKEEDIDNAINADLQAGGAAMTEITDRAVVKGDIVNIDYEGLKDGDAFEGGTAAGYDLTIGSNTFIPGFEDQIIGAKTGDKIDVNVTFPENYGSDDLAGKPVVFKVTVNKIQKYELTEDYVKNNTEFATIDAYRESIKSELQLSNEQTMRQTKESNVYDAVVAGSEIKSIPQTLLDYYVEDIKVFYTNYAVMYGMDFAGFLAASGVTEEDFNKDAQSYADSMATRELVMNAIMKAENLELTEEEFQTKIAEFATEYGFENPEAFLEEADEKVLREDILFQKVMDFVVAEAIEL